MLGAPYIGHSHPSEIGRFTAAGQMVRLLLCCFVLGICSASVLVSCTACSNQHSVAVAGVHLTLHVHGAPSWHMVCCLSYAGFVDLNIQGLLVKRSCCTGVQRRALQTVPWLVPSHAAVLTVSVFGARLCMHTRTAQVGL